MLAEVPEHAHDARVVEPREQPRLDLEARRVAQVEQPLDRHLGAGLDVPRAHDLAHRAARDRRHDRVDAAQQNPGLERDDAFWVVQRPESSPSGGGRAVSKLVLCAVGGAAPLLWSPRAPDARSAARSAWRHSCRAPGADRGRAQADRVPALARRRRAPAHPHPGRRHGARDGRPRARDATSGSTSTSKVSRVHATLERAGPAWTVVDDGLSANGSFCNGERVQGRRRLADGDELRFGRTAIVFREPVVQRRPRARRRPPRRRCT